MGGAFVKCAGFEQMLDDVKVLKEAMKLLNGNVGNIEKGTKLVEGNLGMIDSAKSMLDSKVGGLMGQLSQVSTLTNSIKSKVDGVEKDVLAKFPDAAKHLQ